MNLTTPVGIAAHLRTRAEAIPLVGPGAYERRKALTDLAAEIEAANRPPPIDLRRALAAFFLSAFSTDELLRFLRWGAAPAIVPLILQPQSPAAIADQAAGLLIDRRLLTPEFWERLCKERPRRVAEIDALAAERSPNV